MHDNSDEDVGEAFKNVEELKKHKLREKKIVLIHFVSQILNIKNENTTRAQFLRRKGLSPIDDVT